ncbi:MAG: hypothetical protein OXC91_02235 [Rhodobacteraceae bacterium]|nr:hypothetical protein [Paracoccaceae bacterium]
MLDPHGILARVLSRYKDADKWVDASFEQIKRISNTKVGDVGQDFIEELCGELKFDCSFPEGSKGKRSRQSPWDIRIEGRTFELKTATEDVSGSFQFNHIRYQRQYEGLLCVGIAPEIIHFGTWTKAEVATGMAGNLVSMEKGGSASFKLTKRPHDPDIYPITQFEDRLLDVLGRLDA